MSGSLPPLMLQIRMQAIRWLGSVKWRERFNVSATVKQASSMMLACKKM